MLRKGIWGQRERSYQLFAPKSSANLPVTGREKHNLYCHLRFVSSDSPSKCHDHCVLPVCLPGTLYFSLFIVCILVIYNLGFFCRCFDFFKTSIWLFYFVSSSSVRDATLEVQSLHDLQDIYFFMFWVLCRDCDRILSLKDPDFWKLLAHFLRVLWNSQVLYVSFMKSTSLKLSI